MNVVQNYKDVNLENEKSIPDSIFNTYKKLFKLRKDLHISNGKMDFIELENNDSYIYTNKLQDATLLVVANFRNKDIVVELDIDLTGFVYFMGNDKERAIHSTMSLAPYETLVYIKK
jgi:glycosidase